MLEGLEALGALQRPFLAPFLCQVLEGIMVLCLPADAAVWSLRLQLASCSVMTMHEACNEAARFVLSGRGISASSLDGNMACACAPLKGPYRPACAPWLCVYQTRLCGGPLHLVSDLLRWQVAVQNMPLAL